LFKGCVFVYVWFPFEVYGCGVKVRFLWNFWWKGKTFIWFHCLVFCRGKFFVRVLGLWCLNIFVSLLYDAEKDGLCAHFESVFLLNEWWVGVLDGFAWIVCCHELVVWYKYLKFWTFMATIWYKYLKFWTFMATKGITEHGGQCNELLICRTWCKPSKIRKHQRLPML